MDIDELKEKGRELAADHKELLSGDDVTEEDLEKADELEEEMQEIQERIDRMKDAKSFRDEFEEATREPASRGGEEKNDTEVKTADQKANTYERQAQSGGSDDELDADLAKDAASRFLKNKKAWGIEDEEVKSAYNTLVGEEGQFMTLPSEWSSEILERLDDPRHIRGRANTDTTSNKSLKKRVKDVSANVVWLGEAKEVPETDPNGFGTTEFTPKKMAAYTEFTREQIQETRQADIVDEVMDDFETAILEQEEKAFLNGDGNEKPKGILTEDTDGFNASGGPISYDDLNKLEHSLKAPYRRSDGIVMMAHRKTVEALRGIKDNDGRPILRGQNDGVATDQPKTVLGYPVLESEFMTAPADASDGEPLIIFGDLDKYQIVDRENLRMERVPGERLARRELRGFALFKSTTGQVVDSDAFHILNK